MNRGSRSDWRAAAAFATDDLNRRSLFSCCGGLNFHLLDCPAMAEQEEQDSIAKHEENAREAREAEEMDR